MTGVKWFKIGCAGVGFLIVLGVLALNEIIGTSSADVNFYIVVVS